MTQPSVVVLDYGSGNVHSVAKALESIGARVSLSSDPSAVDQAAGLLVPGVGAFSAVMAALQSVRGAHLIERRLAGGRPVLGICVGMQVLFDSGTERAVTTPGLGQWPGEVSKLRAEVLPHIGWNTVDVPEGSVLFRGIEQERFYFVHSNAVREWRLAGDGPLSPAKLAWAHHGESFLAAVENGPLSATQFHPEKSGRAGLRLLSNWVATLRGD